MPTAHASFNCFKIQNMKDNNNLTPVAVYDNAKEQKAQIKEDNKGKSGIYR
jgi:hypothetical protein